MSQNPNSTLRSSGLDFVPTIRSDTYDYIKPEQFDFGGRAIFITGASKGLGQAVATSFARAGASFIGLGARSSLSATETAVLDAAKEAGCQAPKVLSVQLDVVDRASVEAAAKEVESSFGKLDILINNAGFLGSFTPIAESDVDEWFNTWDINVKGIYLVTRIFLPLMLGKDDGLKTIVNASSYGAHNTTAGASAYQGSKLAVCRFSEFVSKEYGEQGILSYAVHPGGVATELALNMPDYMHSVLKDTPQLSGDSIVWYTAEKRDWLAGRFVSVTWDAKEFLEKREKIEKGDLLKVRMDVGLE